MSNYKPVKHAYNVHEPDGGADPSLPPVIFLHGLITSKESWKDIPHQVAIKTKRKVYNVDIRNHGDTEWSSDFDFDVLKKDLLHFMDTLNIPKAAIIAHSLAAITAIQVAFEHSERVDKVVIVEMRVRKLEPTAAGFTMAFSKFGPKALSAIPKGATEDDAARLVLETVCNALPPDSVKNNRINELDKTALALRKKKDGSYEFKANLEIFSSLSMYVAKLLIEPKGTFNGPALFIYGTHSSFQVGKEISHIKRHFPDAEFVEINDGGHYLHHEKPQEFIDAIWNFFCDYI